MLVFVLESMDGICVVKVLWLVSHQNDKANHAVRSGVLILARLYSLGIYMGTNMMDKFCYLGDMLSVGGDAHAAV